MLIVEEEKRKWVKETKKSWFESPFSVFDPIEFICKWSSFSNSQNEQVRSLRTLIVMELIHVQFKSRVTVLNDDENDTFHLEHFLMKRIKSWEFFLSFLHFLHLSLNPFESNLTPLPILKPCLFWSFVH